jgi:hypothetical protein
MKKIFKFFKTIGRLSASPRPELGAKAGGIAQKRKGIFQLTLKNI